MTDLHIIRRARPVHSNQNKQKPQYVAVELLVDHLQPFSWVVYEVPHDAPEATARELFYTRIAMEIHLKGVDPQNEYFHSGRIAA